METTLSVRLDVQLKEDAERTLEQLGLPLSSAVRVFLAEVVRQQQLPFAVQDEPAAPSSDAAPPEIQAEILLELMSAVAARLARLEAAETVPAKRAEVAAVRNAVLTKRFAFDPHDAVQVGALLREFSSHAQALAGAGAARATGAV